MQLYTNQIFKLSLGALDGEIGKVKDIYFDDSNWMVRYLVADTGNWLFERKVLISPIAVEQPFEIHNNVINLKLDKQQVKNSPEIDTDLPFSLQQESSLFDHYSWPSFGRAGMGWPTTSVLRGTSAVINKAELQAEFDPHLRSFQHISKYEVYHEYGRVGIVKDLIVDTVNWSIPFLLFDDVFTSDQERVVVSTTKILSIDWDTFQIRISLSQEEVKNAPRINAVGFFSNDLERLPPLS
ncbi:MAG: PRC-barrel domain containing protein [Flavobacterium sp.]|nr:MAG: PRC-barrel domain containing protein [Flavobacterium sp.]